MKGLSIEFLTTMMIVIDLMLMLFLLYFVRSIRTGLQREISARAAEKVFRLIEPLFKEAEMAAKDFEKQLREKNQIIKQLNEKLDSRIISLNLLLNRADLNLRSGSLGAEQAHVYDQQTAIGRLYEKGYDAASIARELTMPKGEVELVIDLKKKLLAMG
ncbi:MAG: DUF6115 domain-containing protein [Thermodesulfobacteriota bacterium]